MSVSNAIILLDMIQTGITINLEIQNAIRQAELEGRDISKAELKALADDNDALFNDVLDGLN